MSQSVSWVDSVIGKITVEQFPDDIAVFVAEDDLTEEQTIGALARKVLISDRFIDALLEFLERDEIPSSVRASASQFVVERMFGFSSDDAKKKTAVLAQFDKQSKEDRTHAEKGDPP